MLRVLSLGAGVQSTTLALMAAHGEIEMPDLAIFADTGWEPSAVYAHLDELERTLPFQVVRARRAGLDLGEMAIQIASIPNAKRTASPPWFTRDPDGMLPQQCSKEFKTRVVAREIRKLLPRKARADLWLGISRDEAGRMKTAEASFLIHKYPLIDAGMTRMDCLSWLHRRGYPRPPKSACIFCPWTDAPRWLDRKQNHPDDWNRAVAFDAAIRAGFVGMSGSAYVHRQRVPLDQADLDDNPRQADLFGNECEGMCGV